MIPSTTFDPHLPDIPDDLGFPPDHPVTKARTPDPVRTARIDALIASNPQWSVTPPAKPKKPIKPIDIVFHNAQGARRIMGEISQSIAAEAKKVSPPYPVALPLDLETPSAAPSSPPTPRKRHKKHRGPVVIGDIDAPLPLLSMTYENDGLNGRNHF